MHLALEYLKYLAQQNPQAQEWLQGIEQEYGREVMNAIALLESCGFEVIHPDDGAQSQYQQNPPAGYGFAYPWGYPEVYYGRYSQEGNPGARDSRGRFSPKGRGGMPGAGYGGQYDDYGPRQQTGRQQQYRQRVVLNRR